MPRVSVSFVLPDPLLRRLISTYYFVATPETGEVVEDVLHPEWANIRVALGGVWTVDGALHDPGTGAVIYGPTSRAQSLAAQGGVGLGIGLLPFGWAWLVDAPAAKLADRCVPLAAAMGEEAAAEIEAVRTSPDAGACAERLDKLFLRLIAERPEPTEAVQQAHMALMRPEIGTVGDFAAALGLSTRQAHRLSLQAFGFPPKLLLRRQRFLRTLAELRENLDRPWADLIDARYYDQSHLVRDFHRFMGMSPTRYFALPREILEPAAVARIAGIGQAMQGLQPPAPMSDSSKPNSE